ncbi:Os01g0175633 [Oryza sativa Japonica Group]|uniref:Os01g0175633 protein n=1 Tax=Oryza sativa subsp. japonica TaxID=39947 RepID=A0A0P0UYN5_ORYSJ|nr:hypothetical protein EE612_000552 [Oryza sativa]BAS70668.1 Os01g0175633 [Oryza sativa Japonica Group]
MTGIAPTQAPTNKDCSKLLSLCSFTRTGKCASICFIGSNSSANVPSLSPSCSIASFKLFNSLSTESYILTFFSQSISMKTPCILP